MAGDRRWIALEIEVHPEDRPRLEGLLVDWEVAGVVEGGPVDDGPHEALTAHLAGSPADAEALGTRCGAELASPPFSRPVRWRIEVFDDQDWTAPAREHFRGVEVGGRLSVLPPWAPADHPLASMEVALRIDPGQAFGTGTHESTRLMLGWLLEEARPGQAVLDLGAGSGILSVAAGLLGAGGVTAVEVDPDTVDNARRNFALNGVSDLVDHRIADFTRADLEPADLVLCNMLIELFEPHLARLRGLTRPGGALVLAGFLVIDEAALLGNLRAVGLTDSLVRRDGEWSSALVRRR